jgi:cell division protein FtsB
MEERLAKFDVWTQRLATPWLFWPVCLIGVCLVGLAVLGPEAARNLDVKRQCAVMKAEVDALAQTRDQDAAIERALQDDPATIERVVRHELGLVRPGEIRLPQRVRPTISKDSPESAVADVPMALRTLALFGEPMMRFITMVIGGTLLVTAILFSLPGRAPPVQTMDA